MSARSLSWAFQTKVGNHLAKYLLIVLTESGCDGRHDNMLSNLEIAQIMEISEDSVKKAKNFLKKKGLVLFEDYTDSFYLNIPENFMR
jgi:hypothetical protein